MFPDSLVGALSEHGPWVLMVFFLLYRDVQKDTATRKVLDQNTKILVELTTMIRERLPRGH
ncbi:hypothetical protein AQS8620_03055 [Aquimixticola soesokkakensis]|uniref:Uncharacterized protein n=1 Tax=Aquimixticola soesokkakensis TaxID=1519096 RepID=A0A1Y5TN86_9RHOB|nr:hypothetical protein [Aquimixticola soesokkakensis]SLN65851.1 hypothetical protein AQS8620_03055 [Aquimixticola soesokkakensis]